MPISWTCKKQNTVSHSSPEAEIISLDAGLRMDGIPALDLWDLVKEVFHSSPNQFNNTKDQVRGNSSRNTTSKKHTQNQTKGPTQHDNLDLSDVDYVPSNAKFSRFGTMLNISEDNEAVIKMIIQGRSPTMRHVSRTHRVALDCLFYRIYLDPKIQIKYVDTEHQLADTLTKENFTRDEWSNFLHLFNTSHFSLLCCSKNFSLTSKKTMAKRMQEQEAENRIVAKSKPTTMNLAFTLSRQVLRLCRIRLRRIAREYSKHPVEQMGQVQGNLTQKNTIKTHRRVLKECKKMQFWM